jgi:hypothetical protein
MGLGERQALKPALAWPHEMSIRAWVSADRHDRLKGDSQPAQRSDLEQNTPARLAPSPLTSAMLPHPGENSWT